MTGICASYRGTMLPGAMLCLGCFLWISGCRSNKKEPWEEAPLRPDQVEQVTLQEEAALRIDRVRFFYRELNEPRFFLALVPKAGAPLDQVWILNHGWADRPETMLAALKIDQVYARLLAERKVHPALIVLPDVRFPAFFRNRRNEYPFAQYLTLVGEDAARTVSTRYNIPFSREKWGIGGFSFGGYLSLDVGRRYPGRFGSVSVVSGFYEEGWTFWPASPPPPGAVDAQGRGMQTIVVPGPTPSLFLACGTEDGFYSNMVQLRQKLERLGLHPQWSSGPGAHSWTYWASVLEPMFLFHLGTQAQE